MSVPQCKQEAISREALRRAAEEYGIGYTLHLDENLNLFDFNPRIARAWRETMLDAIGLAKELQIPVLNMHMNRGIHFTLPERKVFLFEQYRGTYLEGVREFRRACEDAVGGSNVTICVENLSGYHQWQLEALDALLESPVFGLTWDVGHDHCTGGGDGAFIRQRADRLRHMHLHDARRPGRDHLALGTGELDLLDRLELARDWGCTVVVEIKTARALRDSVSWLERNWK